MVALLDTLFTSLTDELCKTVYPLFINQKTVNHVEESSTNYKENNDTFLYTIDCCSVSGLNFLKINYLFHSKVSTSTNCFKNPSTI